LDAGTWQRGLVNQSSFKLNEHGPALNVFWSRRGGMGAGGGVADFAAGRKQVKANHAQEKRPTKALDEAGWCLQNEPEGCGLGARPFGSMWMKCFHLLRRARTRWVTERIASAQAMARRLASGIERRNDRFE